MWRNKNSHTLLVGFQSGTANLKDSSFFFFFFNETEHIQTIQPINPAPWYLPKRVENV